MKELNKIIEKCFNKIFLLDFDVKFLLNIKDIFFCNEILLILYKIDNIVFILVVNIVNYIIDYLEYDIFVVRILLYDLYIRVLDSVGELFEVGYWLLVDVLGNFFWLFINKWRDLVEKYGEKELDEIVKFGFVYDFNRLIY